MPKNTQTKILLFWRTKELENFLNEFSMKNKIISREIKVEICKDSLCFVLILDYEVE